MASAGPSGWAERAVAAGPRAVATLRHARMMNSDKGK